MLPSDDAILLSLVNTYLRDGEASLGEVAEKLGAKEGEIEARLASFGYEFSPEANAFRPAK